MENYTGIGLVILAGLMQGSFVLPMTLVRNWKWENTWLVFSVLGMVMLNLMLAFSFIPELHLVYRGVETRELMILGLFGVSWGLGAVLFGLGMERLGMSLGYPIIMGLIASTGGLLPMFVQYPSEAGRLPGLLMMGGVAVAIAGIAVCAKAAVARSAASGSASAGKTFAGSLAIAVAAGLLSSLPNIGFSFGTAVTRQAIALGTAPAMAGNAVWALFFIAGFFPNLIYTLYLLRRNGTLKAFTTQFSGSNLLLGLVMAVLWISSFYLYGTGSEKLGNWGNIVGWPLFISVSIVAGNMWGLWRGEWKGSSPQARSTLNAGILILIAAMVIMGMSNFY
jgi:L-rhamnose-H+ transport protein